MTLPDTLQLNAWSGAGNTGDVAPDLQRKLLGLPFAGAARHLPSLPADERDWQDPRVGWGIILPDRDDIPASARARADDAPAPIRQLVAARGDAPVFRVGPDWQPGTLRRYRDDGNHSDWDLGAFRYGIGPSKIPRYLLIVGSPADIPWDVQYNLQPNYFVGRLDLDEAGLEHYVDALLSEWSGAAPNRHNTLCWSVDHGGGDITTLMKNTVGKAIHDRFANDTEPELVAGARFVTGMDATHDRLADEISSHAPALVVTTSHGQTAPLTDTGAMRAGLGLLIDDGFSALDPALLAGPAAPGGAVWFAQACCSAGSSARTAYGEVLKPGSEALAIVEAVAACGETVAPLPRALLGGARPLRAFVGHVEPTFDWSLRNRQTGQWVTSSILDCFHQMLFTGHPIGMALDRVRAAGASFRTTYDLARERLTNDRDLAQLGTILATKLVADDWRSIVLLGDPTVRVV